MSLVNVGNNNGLSTWKASAFIVCGIVGPGILALPKAVNESGWIGLMFLAVCGIASSYTGVILGKAWLIVESRNPQLGGYVADPYPIIGEQAYGKYGRHLVSSSVNFTLVCMSMLFIVLAADNIDHMLRESEIRDIPFCSWIIILSIVMIPVLCLGTPTNVWFWRTTIVVAVITVIGCIMLMVEVLLHVKKESNHIPSSSTNFFNIFSTFGTVVFAFGGHPALPSIQTNMSYKENFKWACIVGYMALFLLYFPTTTAGLFVYGKYINENILKNTSDGPSSYIIQTIFTLHSLMGFVIVLNPVCQEIEGKMKISHELNWRRIVVRPVVVSVVMFLALTIPCFRAILSLVGGLTITLLAYICPSVFYLKLCRSRTEDMVPLLVQDNDNADNNRRANSTSRIHISILERLLHYVFILVGLFAGLASTISSIRIMINSDPAVSFFTVPCYVNMSLAEPNYVNL